MGFPGMLFAVRLIVIPIVIVPIRNLSKETTLQDNKMLNHDFINSELQVLCSIV